MKKDEFNYHKQIQAIRDRCLQFQITPYKFETDVLMPTFEKIVALSKDRPVTSADILIFLIESVVSMQGWEDYVLLDLLGRVKNSG